LQGQTISVLHASRVAFRAPRGSARARTTIAVDFHVF
jgi:hypothetical protein